MKAQRKKTLGTGPPKTRKSKVKQLISNMNGPTALPRKNGELVFESPWESKIFGVVVALHEGGLYEWDEFRKILIEEIQNWESRSTPNDKKWNYYERWLSSLEQILIRKGIFCKEDLDRRTQEFESGLRDGDHHKQALKVRHMSDELQHNG